jgi:hypothetical protein
MWSERVAGGLAATLVLVGCGVNSADDDPTPGSDPGEVTYDLTTPPTRDQVGMAPGEKVVIDETESGRPVTVALPEERRLATEVHLVTFDSYAAGVDADTADPTGMDMHTPRMGISAATDLLRDSLRQLGGSERIADTWRQAAASAAGTETVRSENVPYEVGYLTARVQARYSPIDEQASVAYVFFWGEAQA